MATKFNLLIDNSEYVESYRSCKAAKRAAQSSISKHRAVIIQWIDSFEHEETLIYDYKFNCWVPK